MQQQRGPGRRTDSDRRSDSDRPSDSGRRILFVPTYGPIEAVLGYGFFYVLVAVGTPIVRDAVADSPLGIDPGLVTLAAAGALWVILGLTILGQLTEQWRDNPRRFEDAESTHQFLTAIAPSISRMQGWALLALLGLVVVVFGFEAFLDSYRLLLEGMVLVVGTGENASMVFRSLPWVIVYTIGFSLVTRYTDRLILGWDRRRRLRRV